MSNTILTQTDHEVNTETAVTFADMTIGQRFFVTISGQRQLVEKTEYIKNGSYAHNVRKLEGRGGRGFVYRDATVTPEAQQYGYEEEYAYIHSHPGNGYGL